MNPELKARLQQLAERQRQLCYEIEKLPASEQATAISVLAADIRQEISEICMTASGVNDGDVRMGSGT